MHTVVIPMSLAVVTILASGASHAVDVAVVDAEGRPPSSATAVCLDPTSTTSFAVSEGRVNIAENCRRVRCEANGSLPGEVDLHGAAPRCVLRPAVVISGQLPAAAAATELDVTLVPTAKASVAVTAVPIPKAADGEAFARFSLPPVKPGRYAMEIRRKGTGWICRADLGPLGPGRYQLHPAWREPSNVRFRVSGADGKPAPAALLRAWSRRPAIGAWICTSSGAPLLTDASGVARVPLDLPGETLVAAGDWKDPRGLAYVTFDRAPSAPVTLTLSSPVRLRARVDDDKGRPVACDALIADVPADLAWLTTVVTGANLKGSCDPRAGLALGPFPSTPMVLEVRPRVGLPMRIPFDAPAPGTIVDLGVLRVRNGESVRVVVQDDLGAPMPGAKVTVRASAGILLTVSGSTGQDGGVDLAGLPKNATIAFDVTAKGFLKHRESRLEAEASPFVVKLSRGASISGRVRDAEGQPVEGAEITLAGDKNEPRRPEKSDAEGLFVLDGVDDGTWRLTAAAEAYATSDPVESEVRDHRPVAGVALTLTPADGIAGRVVDAAGASIAGALVRLVSQRDEPVGRTPAIAETTSDSDGKFRLRAAAPPQAWIVGTKPGFGTGAIPASDGATPGSEAVVTLLEPAALVVRFASGARTSRNLFVRDGAGIVRAVPPAGATEFTFADLAPGRGAAGLVDGPEKSFTLVARETAEVTLDAEAAVEGKVTFEGAPSARAYVRATHESETGGFGAGAGSFTDDRGRYRIDGLGAGAYRIVAVGEDGRAEVTREIADGETARVDLALRSVRLIVHVVDGATDKPIGGVSVAAIPGGKSCGSMMGMSSSGDPGDLGFDVLVGANGCVASQTNTVGTVRLVLSAPGSYDLQVSDDAYEPWTQAIALVDGTTTKRVPLTRKPDQSGDKPHVIANLRTDPPGLSGTVSCIAGGNTNSSSPASGRFDCGAMIPGPGEVAFHIEGFGRGRTAFTVPASGEIVVDVDVTRGGTVIVPVSDDSPVQPVLVDGSGFTWSDASGRARVGGTLEDVSIVGRAWVFRDMPPGAYTASINGKARPPVPLASGGTAIAY